MNKKFLDWQILLGLGLICLSVIFYVIHYLIFRDPRHIFIYLLGDLAFVFIQVLLVTLVLERFLYLREKQSLLKKLNMVIGTFFSELGYELLKMYNQYDENSEEITKFISLGEQWDKKRLVNFRNIILNHKFLIDAKKIDLVNLKNFLKSKRDFLLRVLENPNILEHEAFTNLLWAVFHLTEELLYREDLTGLPDSDYEHLSNDIIRIYKILFDEWLRYVEHLRREYPYLFSLVLRTNPFNPEASVVVKNEGK
jgi:hypothetical protein